MFLRERDSAVLLMDIVFESKENRKKRKLMGKRHVEGLAIETRKEE